MIEYLVNSNEQYFIYYAKKYQDFKKGLIPSKFVTKEAIIVDMINRKQMKMSFDKKTGTEKIPDDRPVRDAVSKLIKNGLPVLSSSSSTGYYICDSVEEIRQPKEENKKRALSILAKQRGFDIMENYVNGQIDITEINLEEEEK